MTSHVSTKGHNHRGLNRLHCKQSSTSAGKNWRRQPHQFTLLTGTDGVNCEREEEEAKKMSPAAISPPGMQSIDPVVSLVPSVTDVNCDQLTENGGSASSTHPRFVSVDF